MLPIEKCNIGLVGPIIQTSNRKIQDTRTIKTLDTHVTIKVKVSETP